MNQVPFLPEDLLNIQSERKEGCLVITACGEMDISNAPVLHEAFQECYCPNEVQRVIFDISNLRFIDSEGIKALEQCLKDIGGKPTTILHKTRMQSRMIEILGPGLERQFQNLIFRRTEKFSPN